MAEGVVNVNERLDWQMSELRQEMRGGFKDLKALMRVSDTELDAKHGDLAGRIEQIERGASHS